jgi:hypothetical protein
LQYTKYRCKAAPNQDAKFVRKLLLSNCSGDTVKEKDFSLSPQHFRNSSTTPIEKKENQYEKKRKGSV